MKKMIICIAVLAVIGLSIQGYNALQQPGNTGKVIVSWDANTEADLAGYKIYWGKASRSYFYNIDVGNITSKQIEGLETGTRWCFAVTAYDTAKNESDF